MMLTPCQITKKMHFQFICGYLAFCFFLIQLSASTLPPVILETHSLTPLENILTGMLLEPDGSLLVLENDGGRISRLVLDANKNLIHIETVADGLTDPVALLKLGDGSLAVGERKTGNIIQIKNNSKTVLAGGFFGLSSVRRDANGILWITELDAGRLQLFDPATGNQAILCTGLDFPTDVYPMDHGFVLTELVGPPGYMGRVSMGTFKDSSFSSNDFKHSMPISIDWQKDESVTDPIRVTQDMRNPENLLISARIARPVNTPPLPPEGTILSFNFQNRKMIPLDLGNFLSPAEVVSVTDGFYLIEEMAERISFVSWQGIKKIIWDGLGGVEGFTSNPLRDNEIYVVKNNPDLSIIRIGEEPGVFAILPTEYRHERIGGILLLPDGCFLISVLSQGVILKLDNSGVFSVLSTEIFSPGKMRLSKDGAIYVLDNLSGAVMQLDLSTGKIIQIYNDKSVKLMDFELEMQKDAPTTIVSIDNRAGNKLLFDRLSGQFKLTGTIKRKGFPFIFARIPGQGFLIALNDMEGTLYWSSDSGEETVLSNGYFNINQISYNGNNKVTLFSRNGWLRTLTLSFQTSIPDWMEY